MGDSNIVLDGHHAYESVQVIQFREHALPGHREGENHGDQFDEQNS
jgi:hypothetical protein